MQNADDTDTVLDAITTLSNALQVLHEHIPRLADSELQLVAGAINTAIDAIHANKTDDFMHFVCLYRGHKLFAANVN